jgi:hypothetical protein
MIHSVPGVTGGRRPGVINVPSCRNARKRQEMRGRHLSRCLPGCLACENPSLPFAGDREQVAVGMPPGQSAGEPAVDAAQAGAPASASRRDDQPMPDSH